VLIVAALAAPMASLAPAEERHMVETLLNARAMRPHLARAFRLGTAASCHVVDAKYEPRSRCQVLYQLGSALVTAILAPAGADGAHDDGVAVPPGARAYLFPEDPVLRGLPGVLDRRTMAELLRDGLGDRVLSCRLTVLRYRPGKRCTLRIEARIKRPSGDIARQRLIGKVYASSAKAEAVYRETLLLTAALAGRTGLVLAPALAFLPEVPMVLQRPVRGASLDHLLRISTVSGLHHDVVAGIAAAASGLAALHQAPPVSSRRRPVDAELLRFRERAARIAHVDTRVGSRLADLVAALTDARCGLPEAQVGLVHGDCKPSQFCIDGEAVALLDFDHCGLADPASDVGTFLATLRQMRVRESLPGQAQHPARLEQLSRIRSGFLGSYRAGTGEGVELVPRAAWYEVVALVRKALRGFARAPSSPLPWALAAEAGAFLEAQGRRTR
jgi:hypothetical protein